MRHFVMILVALVFICLMLVGCVNEKIIYRDVLVPVPQECPKPPAFQSVMLPLEFLRSDATPRDIAEAFVKSVQMLRTEVHLRDVALDVYRTPVRESDNAGPKTRND